MRALGVAVPSQPVRRRRAAPLACRSGTRRLGESPSRQYVRTALKDLEERKKLRPGGSLCQPTASARLPRRSELANDKGKRGSFDAACRTTRSHLEAR